MPPCSGPRGSSGEGRLRPYPVLSAPTVPPGLIGTSCPERGEVAPELEGGRTSVLRVSTPLFPCKSVLQISECGPPTAALPERPPFIAAEHGE